MKKKVETIIIVCDSCGEHFVNGDGFTCYTDDPDGGNMLSEATSSGWLDIDGRQYCPDCWHYDDDDSIVCGDGRKWTDYDHKEIRQHRMNYLSLSDDMTLTQFRMELIKGKALCNTMVGTLYKGMLLDDLAVGKEWFEKMMAARKGTAEFDCYYTFMSHGIFRLAQNDAYERMYNHNRQ